MQFDCTAKLLTILHIFSYSVLKKSNVGIHFFTWWNNLEDIQIPTQCECLEENILFGFQTEGDIFTVLNFCIHNENGFFFSIPYTIKE